MANPTGFLHINRVEPALDSVAERTQHFNEFHSAMEQSVIVDQAARCMDCGVPFCNAGALTQLGSIGCPLGNLIPETNDLVFQGKFQLAYERLAITHPFPEFTSRVCPALCEGSCTLGEHEAPIAVKEIERFLSDMYGVNSQVLAAHKPLGDAVQMGSDPIQESLSQLGSDPIQESSSDTSGVIYNASEGDKQSCDMGSKSIAVIGSGPAGLAAASTLNKSGYSVTVYERSDSSGGLLMYGIPNMKLDKQLVSGRVSLLKQAGVKFVTNCEVGRDITFANLKSKHAAVIVCIGATLPRPLTIEGAELAGVVPAVQYLTANTKHVLDSDASIPTQLNAAGKNVVIIGGGDTGTDCIATALRQGAVSVRQIEINPASSATRAASNPWPLWPFVFKTDYAQIEAQEKLGSDPREFASSVTKIFGDSKGNVNAVETAAVTWEMVEGQRKLNVDESTKVKRPAEMVIFAMGFLGPEPELLLQANLVTNERSNIKTEAGKYSTSQTGVFTAGDCHRGQSLVVWAIAEGISAANECMQWLNASN